MGILVTSRWHDYGSMNQTQASVMDVEDVEKADLVLCVTGDRHSRGGKHAEVGAALALGKPVLLLGPREMVHHYNPLVRTCRNRAELVDYVKIWSA